MPQNFWAGDGRYTLPALRVEPYRLWFEMLKLAYSDPSLKINAAFYKKWGDVKNTEFKSWWSQHWRELFAIDLGVYEITDVTKKIDMADDEIVVRIPLHQDASVSVRQIKNLLAERGARQRLTKMPKGQFKLSTGKESRSNSTADTNRLMGNLNKIRILMHFYRFWLKNKDLPQRKRVEQTARDYHSWVTHWNRSITANNWKRPKSEIPSGLIEYVNYLDARDKRRASKKSIGDAYGKANNMNPNEYRKIYRYIEKAQRLARNVSMGQFTGNYEN